MKTRFAAMIAVLAVQTIPALAQQEVVIEAFESSGQLVFDRVTNAESYRVEWAPSLEGPWTNFTGHTGLLLDYIPGLGNGVITASVPMVYRVVVSSNSVTNTYLVIDLSSGFTNKISFPVSYLSDVPAGGWTEEYKTTKLVLRRIPAGTFTMGGRSTDYPGASDLGLHKVTISRPFYMGVFEVTQRQWERVMGTYSSYFNNVTYRDSRPVEQVSYNTIRGSILGGGWPKASWVDTDSFMGKLRAHTGLAFDLPTESQWEYACRAGTTTALNSGQNLTNVNADTSMDAVGRYYYNHPGGYSSSSSVDTNGGSATVGSYQPNAWGLYDMHGNVREWCLDIAGNYPAGPVTDPVGASSGVPRVYRGGGWENPTLVTHTAYRNASTTNFAKNDLGFRVVLPPGQ